MGDLLKFKKYVKFVHIPKIWLCDILLAKKHKEGAQANIRIILNANREIFHADENDSTISRVYCKACDATIRTTSSYHLSRHIESGVHKGTLDIYNQMWIAGEVSNYDFPYDAARFIFLNKKLYNYVSENNKDFIRINMIPVTINNNKMIYQCQCYCSLCNREIPPNLQSLQTHATRIDHMRDSKGFSKKDFDHDLCELFMKRMYRIKVILKS